MCVQNRNRMMAQTIRVLIADDSARARNGLRALLTTWSAVKVVGEAANGQEAVSLVTECRPDIVLMDVQMPVLDGVQATKAIKQRWPDIKVIVLTMHAEQQTAALAAGADAFMIKGGEPQRLLITLHAMGTIGKS